MLNLGFHLRLSVLVIKLPNLGTRTSAHLPFKLQSEPSAETSHQALQVIDLLSQEDRNR